ncbi:hypothetical protein BC938DRAFT_483510 [Jimgerdemannia flammicorona]|uniref:NADAR domain-containing protein n=1 Tax=Jimgerdemannia flammicorona TaxID=994334 RepID=A0A433QBV3_9FUNG|nr:hypothetical protein BC938DRAFT_483510 [Jimgerdemannia flammicorona]
MSERYIDNRGNYGQHVMDRRSDNEVYTSREMPTSGQNPSTMQFQKDMYNIRRGSCKRCGCRHRRQNGQKVIKFYERNAPYYEFTNFQEGYPIKTPDGHMWPTSEHLFQAQKFAQPRLQKLIREASSPREAFNVAQANKSQQRPDWLDVNIKAMYDTVREKFKQHQHLRDLLLSTGNAELIEHTVNDAFWGDGGDDTYVTMFYGIMAHWTMERGYSSEIKIGLQSLFRTYFNASKVWGLSLSRRSSECNEDKCKLSQCHEPIKLKPTMRPTTISYLDVPSLTYH